jgi:hypothetical protein
VLCSTAIERIKHHCRQQKSGISACTFWYISFADEKTQDLSILLCSIVNDLLSKTIDIPESVRNAYSDANNGNQRPTQATLVRMLEGVVEEFDDVYFFIDALDECPRSQRPALLKTLTDLTALKIDSLHILVTSRREIDVEDSFAELKLKLQGYQEIRVQSKYVEADINTYLEHQMQGLDFRNWKPLEKEKVRIKLAAKADGM